MFVMRALSHERTLLLALLALAAHVCATALAEERQLLLSLRDRGGVRAVDDARQHDDVDVNELRNRAERGGDEAAATFHGAEGVGRPLPSVTMLLTPTVLNDLFFRVVYLR